MNFPFFLLSFCYFIKTKQTNKQIKSTLLHHLFSTSQSANSSNSILSPKSLRQKTAFPSNFSVRRPLLMEMTILLTRSTSSHYIQNNKLYFPFDSSLFFSVSLFLSHWWMKLKGLPIIEIPLRSQCLFPTIYTDPDHPLVLTLFFSLGRWFEPLFHPKQ